MAKLANILSYMVCKGNQFINITSSLRVLTVYVCYVCSSVLMCLCLCVGIRVLVYLSHVQS